MKSPNQQSGHTRNPLEPLCILKIELDGEHVEQIKVYEGENPHDVVENFGEQFNLSDNAKKRLLN